MAKKKATKRPGKSSARTVKPTAGKPLAVRESASFGDRFDLAAIRLLESRTKLNLSGKPLSKRSNIKVSAAFGPHEDQLSLLFNVSCEVVTPDEGGEPAITVHCVQQAVYKLKAGPFPHELLQSNTASVQRMGLFHTWPFIRQFVHTTTLAMGLPALTLPLFSPSLPEGDDQGLIGKIGDNPVTE